MIYAVVNSDNSFSGVTYQAMLPEIKTHHERLGQSFKKVWGLIENFDGNTGEVTYTEQDSDKPEPAPESVTVRQARQWMIENDILPSQVDALIDAIEDEKERELLKNYWEYSTEYQRNHPLLEGLGERLGMTPDELDQAFREASAL